MSKILDRSVELPPMKPAADDDLIICRCEEVTKGEIRRAVHDGMWTVNEVKRFLRCSMGLCQGLTCQKNIRMIMAKELGVPVSELPEMAARPPMRPIEMRVYGKEEKSDE